MSTSNLDPAEAMNLLFVRNATSIRGFILCLAAGDQGLADDVFQEVFLVVSRRAADFRPDGNFMSWVRGIAHNKLLTVLGQRGRGSALSNEVLERLVVEAPIDNRWDRHQQALRACLDRLAPRARELASLRYVDEMKPSAIAERVRWTVNAVNVALSRVRTQLRECCRRRLEAES